MAKSQSNMTGTQRNMFTVICLVIFTVTSVFATHASERQTNNVELTIYQMTTAEWASSLSDFQTSLALQAVAFCTANAATCGLNTSFPITFASSHVGVYSTPEEESKSLKLSVYVDFHALSRPDANAPTQHVVNSAALKAILEVSLIQLETVLNHDITYIGDKFISIEPHEQANKIIIPLAFIVLFAIIFLTIGLHFWKKRQEEAERKKVKSEKRNKKTGRVRPLHGVEDETQNKQASNFWPRRFKKNKAVKVRMESLNEEVRPPRRDNGHIPTLSVKTNMIASDPTKAAATDKIRYEERVIARSDALPPLPSLDQKGTSEDEKEREKKEKKEKKRRKREKRQQEKESGVESESEKSKSESHCPNVVPVEA